MSNTTTRPRSALIWQDTQHNMLFEILDEFAGEHVHPSVIQRLKLYAHHHFCLEEAYMERLNYPNRANHIQAHNRFREELSQLEEDFSQHGMTQALRETVSNFLSEWLARHIQGVDKDFETFVVQSECK